MKKWGNLGKGLGKILKATGKNSTTRATLRELKMINFASVLRISYFPKKQSSLVNRANGRILFPASVCLNRGFEI